MSIEENRLETVTEQVPNQALKGIIIAVIAALIAYFLYKKLPYDAYANKGLALLFFIAVLWLTEAVHITITALIIPIAGVLVHIPAQPVRDKTTGVLLDNLEQVSYITLKSALYNFANPIIFLFFGGFALATALHIQKLDKKIALAIMRMSGSRMKYSVIGLFGVTAVLSMWISNTATAAMMLPLALGLFSNIPEDDRAHNTKVFILLGIAYSASIGGLGTIVGSPPNGIAAIALGLDFDGWMFKVLPLMIVLMPILLFGLYFMFKPKLNYKVDLVGEERIPWNKSRILTMLIFCLIAFLWIFGKAIKQKTGIPLSDGLVALMAVVLVVSLGLCTWHEVSDNTDWGVLLLFGGGLALSTMLQNSGASYILGKQVADTFGNASPIIIIAAVAAFIVFLTEFTSNTASAALLVPVFASIAAQIGMPKEVLVMIIGIGASCAFMLPVATPPNAIVFGTGLIRSKEMLRAGLLLNILSIIVLSIFAYFFLL